MSKKKNKFRNPFKKDNSGQEVIANEEVTENPEDEVVSSEEVDNDEKAEVISNSDVPETETEVTGEETDAGNEKPNEVVEEAEDEQPANKITTKLEVICKSFRYKNRVYLKGSIINGKKASLAKVKSMYPYSVKFV